MSDFIHRENLSLLSWPRSAAFRPAAHAAKTRVHSRTVRLWRSPPALAIAGLPGRNWAKHPRLGGWCSGHPRMLAERCRWTFRSGGYRRTENLILQLDTVCHFLGKARQTGANAEMENRQCLRAFCNRSQARPNGEKGPFRTSDQKVAGSSPVRRASLSMGCRNRRFPKLAE